MEDDLAEATQAAAFATIAWDRFKGHGKPQRRGQSGVQRQRHVLEQASGRADESSCRVEESHDLECGARGHRAEMISVPKTRAVKLVPPRAFLAVAQTSLGYHLNTVENGERLTMVVHDWTHDAAPEINECPKAPPARKPGNPPRLIPTLAPPSSLCVDGCKEFGRRGTNASADRWTCLHVASRAKSAVERSL